MSRKDFLNSPDYWIAKAQIDLYNCAEEFMRSNGMNRSQLAKHLGVSKGYVSQLLNGDYDHKLSKFIELALAFGYVPEISFKAVDEVVAKDSSEYITPRWRQVTYDVAKRAQTATFSGSTVFMPSNNDSNFKAA